MIRNKVLIIDDSKLELIAFAAAFESSGIKAVTTNEPLKALEIAAIEQPDYIVLDLYMPEKNGFELCRDLKIDERTADIPILFVTASDSIDDAIKSIHLGVIDYIHKPVSISSLVDQIIKHNLVKNIKNAYQPMRDEMALFSRKYAGKWG